MKVHRCLIIVYHFKFHYCIFLLCSESAHPLSCSVESPWWSFLWHQHQIQSILCIRGAFCLWADSNLCLLIVCFSPSFTAQKKLPLTSLSQAMVEGGNQLGEDSLIGWVCDFSPEMHVANGSRCNPKGKETTHRQNVQLSVSFMTSL